MSFLTIILTVLFFVLLGVIYVKGYDLVKRTSPEHLVHFYLIMATIRMLAVLTVLGIYILFTSSREDIVHFAALLMTLYVAMMAVTLALRH